METGEMCSMEMEKGDKGEELKVKSVFFNLDKLESLA